ncbi:amidohydrolase family protein [Amycolatopsis dongchuanensis]|uniref:Amidohydrolase family protein n=1 Tax=Amycolatopsis dongchuanensis TaxID=1070866 RepID=A0ABP9PUK8_9PSEU
MRLRAARLFDGTEPRADPVLTVTGERISDVAFGVAAPDALDLGDTTLLPGFVDAHVHLAFDASADPVAALAARDDEQALDAMRAAARTALLGGITTVRDLGDRNYLALRLREEPGPLPTIVAAGPPITTPAGHCHYLGGAVEPTPEAMRAAVRERAERGVDVVKIMASGGRLTPGTRQDLPQFGEDELRAAVEEAHRLGLPVTAHAHAPQGIVNAVEAHVDGVEHVSFWTEDDVDTPSPDLVRRIVERRIAVGATFGLVPGPGRADTEGIVRRMPKIVGNLLELHRAGALMVLSSDAGITDRKPHDVLRHTIVMAGELGLAPAEVLRLVTEVPAWVCGLGGRKGRLAPGFDADVVAVEGDPLADLTAVHRVRAVFARGRCVSRW